MLIGLGGEMGDPGNAVMRLGAAEFFLRHVLMRDGADHVGAGDEHI
jgi:hypothetical protein